MANIVDGFGALYGPLMSTPADRWKLRAEADSKIPELTYRNGTYTYEQLYELRKSNYLDVKTAAFSPPINNKG